MAEEKSRLSKIVDKIVETLIVGLVVGFFAFNYNQSKKVDEVEDTTESLSLVDKQIINDLAKQKADFLKFKNELNSKDPFSEPIQEKEVEEIKEEIQQGIDKEIYRARELQR